MAASKRTLALAKTAARKSGTLPARRSQKPVKQIERNWGTRLPREVTLFAVAALPVGGLVLYKGKPCIILEHCRFHDDRAFLLFPDGQQWAVPYKWLSLPPEVEAV
jgi:hypothetical protein